MNPIPHLLPPNSTAFERTVSVALSPEARGVAVIDQAQRPLTIPEHILPYLAWSWDVPPIWPQHDNQRRMLVAESFKLHQTRGTAHCIKRLAQLADARIVHIQTPPAKLFAGKSLTADERAAFARVHPEIRWYPYQKKGWRAGLMVGDCIHRAHPTRSDAMQRLADRVELHDTLSGMIKVLDHQVITRAATERLQPEVVSVRLIGQAQGVFVGHPLRGLTIDHAAEQRYYTLDLSLPIASSIKQYASLSLSPGLIPLSGDYEPIRAAGCAKNRLFLRRDVNQGQGHAFVGQGALPSSAGLRFGRSLRLYDAARARLQPRQATLFLGTERLTRSLHHHAYAYVDMTRNSPKRKAFVGSGSTKMDWFFPLPSHAANHITRVRQLLSWGLKAADRLWLRTDPYHPITATPAIRVGDAVVGEHRIQAT